LSSFQEPSNSEQKQAHYCLCSENPGLSSPGMNEHFVNNESMCNKKPRLSGRRFFIGKFAVKTRKTSQHLATPDEALVKVAEATEKNNVAVETYERFLELSR
jgi:hypothetical protein